MSMLSRTLRLISTLIAYLAFGLVGASFALILPFALRRLPEGLAGQRRARRIVARIWTG